MEDLKEKENELFQLIHTTRKHGEQNQQRIDTLLQEMISNHDTQQIQLAKEIAEIENRNKLSNLSLQISIIEYMKRNPNVEEGFTKLLSSWKNGKLQAWMDLGENLKIELEKLETRDLNLSIVYETTAQLVSSIADDIYDSSDIKTRKFLLNKLVPLLRENDTVELKKLEEEIKIIEINSPEKPREELNEDNDSDNSLLDKLVRLFKNNLQLVEMIVSGVLSSQDNSFLGIQRQALNLAYLVLPRAKFQEQFTSTQENKAQRVASLKGIQLDSTFQKEFVASTKMLQLEFNADWESFEFSHEDFFMACKIQLERAFAPFIESQLSQNHQKLSLPQVSLPPLLNLFTIIHDSFDNFLKVAFEKLQPNVSEEEALREIVAGCLQKHLTSFSSPVIELIHSTIRVYLDQLLTNSKSSLQARIKFKEANSQVLSTIKSYEAGFQFAEDLGEENQHGEKSIIRNKPAESFSYMGEDRDTSKLIKENNLNEVHKDQKNAGAPSKIVDFKELTGYGISNAVSVSETLRNPEFLHFLKAKEIQKLKELEEINQFENIAPSMISQQMSGFLGLFDSYFEILVKYQKLGGESKNFFEGFVKSFQTEIQELKERVEGYLELDHPDALLYFCDWVFLNYRLNQAFAVSLLFTGEKTRFSEDFLSSTKQSFGQTSAFFVNYFQKKWLNRFFTLAFPAIDNEEWKSFRPFHSLEIKEPELKTSISKLGNQIFEQVQGSYIKNINDGVKLWKNLLQRQIQDLSSFFNFKKPNLIGLKILCNVTTETVSAIYFKYKAIEPSRIRNPQYINDLRFFVDNTLQLTKLILGLTIRYLSQEELRKRKQWKGPKVFLVGTLNSLWWVIKSAKNHIALLQAHKKVLVDFLQHCISGEILLPALDEEFMKNLEKSQPDLITASTQKKMEMMLEMLSFLTEHKYQASIDVIYELFESNMELLSRVEIKKFSSDPKLNNRVTTSLNNLRNDISEQNESREFEESINSLLQPVRNPLLRYGQNLLLFGHENFTEESLQEILKNMLFSPEHILFVIQKRVEFIFSDYPLLSDENKNSQQVLFPVLEKFCQKFGLQMFTIPSL